MKTYTFRSWSHVNHFLGKLDSCCERDDYQAAIGPNYTVVTNATDEEILAALALLAGIVKVGEAK